ncbi:DUF6520 family protein [Allomuricauda sp. ARW1Y1]|jgi:hypothetical protein|uniref:DUF6520 family protein n=1 Tax=Allomuricauda sp. ARW1Y1 TaxID=2663843 RepID=UPI0015C955CC|nr:DUF6520 family protein [Muricauda sp. ARW1Y1]NYJ27825.1 hypothetical protein [Muricauda sp. ARW1Y1]
MKKSFLKIVLPAFAIIMAVGLAFATEEDNSTQTGYYDHPILGVQPIQTDCLVTGQVLCMEGQWQVFKDPELSIPLYIRE